MDEDYDSETPQEAQPDTTLSALTGGDEEDTDTPAVDGEEQEEEGEQEQEQEQDNTRLLEDIFGGDSDLSELEDDSDGEAAPPRRRSPSASRSRSASPAYRRSPSPGRRGASDDDDDGDEYQEKDLSKIKIKKKKRVAGEGGEGGEPKKKRKKTVKSTEVEEDEPEEIVDPETARRRNLNARLDAIIKKPKKASGRKKRGQADEDDIDLMNDEAVAKLRVDMLNAAAQDVEDNESGKYAVNKLRLLPSVVEMMQKTTLAESLVESGALEAVKRWLEPLPDRSLPALNIQRPLFDILRTLSIETSALKSSGLGKIVYFYTKCKRVEPSIARVANQLVSDWMRPIIRRSKAFVDKDLAPVTADYSSYAAIGGATGRGVGGIRKKKELEKEEGTARRHARIPQSLSMNFTVAPAVDARDRPDRGGSAVGAHSITAVSGKMKSYKKKLVAGQQAQRRV